MLITEAVRAAAPWEASTGTTFLIAFVLCGTLEYLTSWFLEKRYHARWWDYSQKPMNLHGRVWIGNLILFGLGGVLIVNVFNPVLSRLAGHMTLTLREGLAIVLSVLFAVDNVMSHFILKLVKTGVENSKADDTEEISKEIRLLLTNRSVFHRRFVEAYPEVIYKTERITARMEAIRVETERLRAEAEQRVAGMKQELGTNLEPTILLKNDIMEKQDEIIRQLYNEDSASKETKALMRELEGKKAILQKRRGLLGKR